MIRRLGFYHVWIRWVMNCVVSVSYNLMINGKRIGSFAPTRDIRQGDPMSPYLFLLVVESLSAIIQKKCDEGVLKGVKMRRNSR